MKREVYKRIDGFMVYNWCMPTTVERFYTDKEWCEEFIKKNHPHAKIEAIEATIYYKIPEDTNLCSQSPKCGENSCYCSDIIKGKKV